MRTRPVSHSDGALCHICGRREHLTFEHVPPRAVGNSTAAEMLGFETWLKRDEASGRPTERGRIQQRGSGSETLCRDCNSRAGAWYVPEFIE